MTEEPSRRQYPGYGTEMLDYPSGRWELHAHDVPLLVSAIGEDLLWVLARCFEAADRLMSLSFLLPSDSDYEQHPARSSRNHFTAFWLANGTMRELALAILALPSLRKRLPKPESLRRWYTLQGIARRWNSDDFTRVRNAVAFHLDADKKLFQTGVADLTTEGQPLAIAVGDNEKHGHASFPFAREIFVRGLWPRPEERRGTHEEIVAARNLAFKSIGGALVRDQTRVGELFQGLLVDLLRPGRGIGPDGCKVLRRRQLVAILQQRRDQLEANDEASQARCNANGSASVNRSSITELLLTEEELADRVEQLYELGEAHPLRAIEEARSLQATPTLDVLVKNARAGLLIDNGLEGKARDAVVEGVAALRELSGADPDQPTYRYNLANGLLALAALDVSTGETERRVAARASRREARALLHSLRSIDARELATQALTNLGNSLDGSHRWSEALDAYMAALDVERANGVAAGCAAETLLRLSVRGLGDPKRLRAVAARYARIAQANTQWVLKSAGRAAVQRFANLPTDGPAEKQELTGVKPYLRWVAEHHLALVPTVEGLDPKLRRWDSLQIGSLWEPVGASAEPPVLWAMFNMIKAGYLQARRMAYRATTTRKRQTGLYVDTLDYAIYGTDIVALLIAQRSAIDVLDQIGVALNDYFRVGIRAQDVTFTKVWRGKKGGSWRAPLKAESAAGNTALVALGELSEDLASGFLNPKRAARNTSTHRFTVLHDESIRSRASEAIEHVGYSEFEMETIETLKVVRAAILYFVEAVVLREHRLHSDPDGIRLQAYVPYHHEIRRGVR